MTVCIDPPGRYDAWGYAIRGDPERPEILRQIPRVRSDRRLRRAVMGIAAIGGRCGPSDRAFREDLPGALSLHEKAALEQPDPTPQEIVLPKDSALRNVRTKPTSILRAERQSSVHLEGGGIRSATSSGDTASKRSNAVRVSSSNSNLSRAACRAK